MKKVVFTILLFMLITNVKAYTNNNNIEITEEEYLNLLSVGFTENEIDNLNYDLYQEYKDTTGIGLERRIANSYIKMAEKKKNNIGLSLRIR